jgi:hypothetical protein
MKPFVGRIVHAQMGTIGLATLLASFAMAQSTVTPPTSHDVATDLLASKGHNLDPLDRDSRWGIGDGIGDGLVLSSSCE